MTLKRSESTRTTLSMYVARKGKYQRWLAIINVLLLLGSICLVFYGSILKLTYLMDRLDFASVYFFLLPWTLIAAGAASFIVSFLGFIFTSVESRGPIMVYATMMVVLCLSFIANVFICLEVRNQIKNGLSEHYNYVSRFYGLAGHESFTGSWDHVQHKLRCCGSNSFLDFNLPPPACVPASCCIPTKACRSFAKCGLDDIWQNSYTTGCMAMLNQLYKDDLYDGLLVVAISSVVVALVSVVGVALASAFVAQITRRSKRWDVGQGMRDSNNIVAMDNF